MENILSKPPPKVSAISVADLERQMVFLFNCILFLLIGLGLDSLKIIFLDKLKFAIIIHVPNSNNLVRNYKTNDITHVRFESVFPKRDNVEMNLY
jgi:hypothetical protein